jgi:antigen flippase
VKTSTNIEDGGYYQTVRSTFIMGGSSVINIFLGIIRTKVIALLLNPSGLGLMGVYQSISNLALTVSGMGINESGTRQVALSFQTKNVSSISRTSLLLRRIALITGIGGTALLVILSKQISLLTFHDREHTLDIALLSLTILFGTISGAQAAIIQGARKISYLAKMNVLGPLWGTILSLPIIYFLGIRGIASYLIIIALTTVVTSWWYSKKVDIPRTKASWRDSLIDAKPIVGLGLALMLGTMIIFGTSYLLRILIIRRLGLDAAGQFQASSLLSTVYVGILFKAMGTDFYPRLSAMSLNDKESCRLVNEQIEAGLLLAVPGVLFTLTFAPMVLLILYSKDFLSAISILRWQILGVLLQVVTWPMGYILRAKASGGLFIVTELYSSVCYIAGTWIGIKYFGLSGIGLAYFMYNALYFVLIYGIVHKKYSFSFAFKSSKILIIAFMATAIAFFISYFIPRYYMPLNSILIIIASIYSYKRLDFSKWIVKIIRLMRRKD